jgi:hypothetical protein
MKKIESFKTIRILLGVFLVLIMIVAFSLFVFKNNSKNNIVHLNSYKKNSIPKVTTNNSEPSVSELYPRESLSCQTSISLVPLSSEYTITGMDCEPALNPSGNVILSCDGTIFNSAISQNCYSPLLSSISNSLSCNGALGQLSGSNMSLNYNCDLPNIANTNIYACNGMIANYTSYAINLSMSVGCSSSSLG